MSTSPMALDEFESALVDRYLQALEHLQTREELKQLLKTRDVFLNASIFMEYAKPLGLILEELRRISVAAGDSNGSDLAELGASVCGKVLKYGQQLPLSLPHAVVDPSGEEVKSHTD